VRLVSLNAWGGRLWPALAAWLPGAGADILCLQEVTRAPVSCPPQLEYRHDGRRLQQRADLYGEVSALMPGHHGQFIAAMRGELYDEAGRPWASEHGNAIWLRRGLTVTAQVQDFVHGDFRPDGWGAPPVPRPVHVARLDLDPGPLVVAHLHGLRDPAGKHDTPARSAQADRLLAALAQVRRPGDPTILCGDLNLEPGSATFARLTAVGLHDLVTGRGFTDSRTSFYAKPGRMADYLLVSPKVRVTGFDLPAAPEVSDHRPLVLDFRPG
jgi:endonuclease/exonuclease/phosphatase family metal-dependent hydrolase